MLQWYKSLIAHTKLQKACLRKYVREIHSVQESFSRKQLLDLKFLSHPDFFILFCVVSLKMTVVSLTLYLEHIFAVPAQEAAFKIYCCVTDQVTIFTKRYSTL